MAKKYDVVAVTGSYMKDGQEKKRYKNVGMINENAEGHLSLHLDHPVTVDDEGKVVAWFSLFEPKERQPGPNSQSMRNDDIDF